MRSKKSDSLNTDSKAAGMGGTAEGVVALMSAAARVRSSLVAGSRRRTRSPSVRRFTPDLVSPDFNVSVVGRKVGSMLRLGSRMSSMRRWTPRVPMPSRLGPKLPRVSRKRCLVYCAARAQVRQFCFNEGSAAFAGDLFRPARGLGPTEGARQLELGQFHKQPRPGRAQINEVE